jgi:Peptidase family M23
MPRRLSVPVVGFTLLLAAPAAARDLYTPLVVSAFLQRTTPVLGTDERLHVVYELTAVNARPGTATLERVAVADDAGPDRALASFDAKALAPRIRMLDNRQAPTAGLDANAMRLVLLDLALAPSQVPRRLVHRLDTMARDNPTATTASPLAYVTAPIALEGDVPIIGPPLSGSHWVAFNGCCAPGVSHRSTAMPVNGQLHFAQRFAIDWMQLDEQGRLLHGDPAEVRSYTAYDHEALAVADGTVTETLDTLDDQVPGKNPDPTTITIDNVDGNHVVLDLGGGRYAFYAHLRKGSIAVRPGDRVQRGQVLGKVGNTGNTSAPHLHFHVMDGPSVLGSEGIPYVIDRFSFAGKIPDAAVPDDLRGDFRGHLAATAAPRERQFPLDRDVIDFGS